MLYSGPLYLLHVETINLLLVLCSTQLYSTSASAPVGTHPFIDALMQQQPLAAPVVQLTLQHYSSRPPLPPYLQLWSPSPDADDKGVLKLVRSAAGQLMTHAYLPRPRFCAYRTQAQVVTPAVFWRTHRLKMVGSRYRLFRVMHASHVLHGSIHLHLHSHVRAVQVLWVRSV